MTQNNAASDCASYTPSTTPVPDGWEARIESREELHNIDAEGETDTEEAVETADRPAVAISALMANADARIASFTS